MTSNWDELCQAEELAYFNEDMVLSSPESYTAEEMWEVVMEMLEATIAVQNAMHEDFMSHTPEQLKPCSTLALTPVLPARSGGRTPSSATGRCPTTRCESQVRCSLNKQMVYQ